MNPETDAVQLITPATLIKHDTGIGLFIFSSKEQEKVTAVRPIIPLSSTQIRADSPLQTRVLEKDLLS